METSTSVAHWRQSRGALKQSWNTTGSFHAYHLTQERPVYRERSRLWWRGPLLLWRYSLVATKCRIRR